jgi:hypothetical protein
MLRLSHWILLFFSSSTIILWYEYEIIQSVAYANYDEFQHVNFIYFNKISFHYFEDYLMTKPTLGWGNMRELCVKTPQILVKILLINCMSFAKQCENTKYQITKATNSWATSQGINFEQSSKSISSGAQYVTLRKIIFTSKFSYVLSCNPHP